MTQFEIDSFATASGGGGGVVSGAYQLSGIYQVSGNYAFDFAKQVSGLYVTHSGGFYAASGTAGGGGTVSGWAQASGFYVEHSGGLYQPSGVYVGASGGLYQASGIFQTSGVFQTSGIYQVSGDYPLAHTKQASGIYLLTSGGLYQVSGVFALSGTAGGGGTSGFIHAGTFLGSGNSSTLLYTLSHGLGQVPDGISVDAASPQARGDIDISGNASGIFVTYTNPPLSGDVKLSWVAGPSASAGGIVSGLFALSGTGGLGGVSGVVHAATFVGSGDNSTTLYTLSHGLGIAPRSLSVDAGSIQARGSFDTSGDASNIYVRYAVAPVSGDVRLYWIAGPTDAANIVTLGSGNVHAATFVGSGNASTTLYTLSHGLATIPPGISVTAGSEQAKGLFEVSGNASGIFVTYVNPPSSGTVRLYWIAGPTTAANIVSISGFFLASQFVGSGNSSTTVYTLSHGLGVVPSSVIVKEATPQARGLFDVSGNASGITVTYTSPPASGTVRLNWMAGPAASAIVESTIIGSGNVHAASFLGSGNNSTTLYTLSHGLETVPTGISVNAASPQARGDYDVSGNASGIFITYTSPPLSGDVRLSWVAGPSTIAVLASGAWQTSGLYVGQSGGQYQASGIYAASGVTYSGIQTITSGSNIHGNISGQPVFLDSTTFNSGFTSMGINHIGVIDISGFNAPQYNLAIQNSASGRNTALWLVPASGGTTSAFMNIYGQVGRHARLLLQTDQAGGPIINIKSLRDTSGNNAGAIYPMAFAMQDIVRGTIIEGMRLTESGNIEFNRSGGTVQFKSGNTAATASGTDANSGAYTPAAYITCRLGTRSIKIPFFD